MPARPHTKSPRARPTPKGHRSTKGQRKSTPKLKLSDPFSDLWKCGAFAVLTQGCTDSEITSDIAEIHARILAIAVAADEQIHPKAIPKPAQAKKRPAKPTAKKVESFGLRRSSRNTAPPKVSENMSVVEMSGVRDTGNEPGIVGVGSMNQEERGNTISDYTGEGLYNKGDKMGDGDKGAKVIPDSAGEEEGGEVGESITVAETDWDETEEEDITTTAIFYSGDEDEEVQESITVLNGGTDNEIYTALPREEVSSSIYLGDSRKRQSGISEYFGSESQNMKKVRR